MGRPREPHVPAPPEGFDSFVEWLGLVSDQLVLLEEFPLAEVREAMDTARGRIQRHLETSETTPLPTGSSSHEAELTVILRSDHHWFETSLEELDGLMRVVAGEDHGGHRQALGQYGRLLAAALTRHRRDEAERERLGRPADGGSFRNTN